jgi:hypothetical protein
MSTKGSRLSRIIAYFKEGELEEVQYVQQRAIAIIADRKRVTSPKVTSTGRHRRKVAAPHPSEQAAAVAAAGGE